MSCLAGHPNPDSIVTTNLSYQRRRENCRSRRAPAPLRCAFAEAYDPLDAICDEAQRDR
jgi:hypothetical protein